ncbi:MAG TPA: beta-phosphoglucomutase, partial [Rhodanobacteraceae bacterium]|nr:beta-phosphoglucomutase [Rhodanobacteraceae bacterium]
LLEGGAEMLFETARLWLEVGRYSPRRNDAFCIFQVTGPDEYTVLVDNDFYTNHMAKKHLAYAADVAEWLAQTYPATFTELQARTGLHADESLAWRQAAEAMYLPPPDERLGVFPQDDTFLDRPLPPDSMVRKAADNPLLLDFHPLTIYRHQVCKQADVLHALALTGEPADRDCRRRNFDYYEAITTHDSTLSLPVFGIAAAQAGYPRKAWEYFQQALRIDVDNLHGNTSHGVHLAAMAGSWMNLTWGFGGCSLRDATPAFAPSLPPAWRGYRFGFLWRGRRLRIAVDAREITYTLLEGQTLDIRHFGHCITLEPGCPQRHPLIDGTPTPRAFKGVIFDLDGVLADTATVHHAAWKKLADELDLPFDDSMGTRLKGVDRMASLEIILEGSSRMYSEAEKADLAERKNHYYREQIARFSPENLLPGARRAVEATRRAGLKTALASASRNAPMLLDRLGIRDLFDYIVDAGRIRHHKPNPEIFLAAAQGLGLDPTDCLGVEDAVAGVAAIRAAGMFAVGISTGDELNDAGITLASIADFDADRLIADTHHTQRTTAGHAPDHDSIHHQPGRVSA